jgi:phage head maturation protease
MEKRFQLTEVRAVKNGDKRTIAGYAARYNLLSGDFGGFRERIASGAALFRVRDFSGVGCVKGLSRRY